MDEDNRIAPCFEILGFDHGDAPVDGGSAGDDLPPFGKRIVQYVVLGVRSYARIIERLLPVIKNVEVCDSNCRAAAQIEYAVDLFWLKETMLHVDRLTDAVLIQEENCLHVGLFIDQSIAGGDGGVEGDAQY